MPVTIEQPSQTAMAAPKPSGNGPARLSFSLDKPQPAIVLKCAACGEEKEVAYSTLRGGAGTFMIAEGYYKWEPWKPHCSIECVLATAKEWAK